MHHSRRLPIENRIEEISWIRDEPILSEGLAVIDLRINLEELAFFLRG
jgi:hypothetical protein